MLMIPLLERIHFGYSQKECCLTHISISAKKKLRNSAFKQISKECVKLAKAGFFLNKKKKKKCVMPVILNFSES